MTRAPSRAKIRAIALPMPDPAPVTIATLLASRIASSSVSREQSREYRRLSHVSAMPRGHPGIARRGLLLLHWGSPLPGGLLGHMGRETGRRAMLAKVLTCAVVGLDGAIVEVEADIGVGLPSFTIVGLPDTAVQEARE